MISFWSTTRMQTWKFSGQVIIITTWEPDKYHVTAKILARQLV